jgi:tetratricopeptide (TPR) repeat protein
MRASREMILFFVALGLCVLLGACEVLVNTPDERRLRVKSPTMKPVDVPDWLPPPVGEGIPSLAAGRFLLPVNPVQPMPPLKLDLPRLNRLPITMPPPAPRPGWDALASLRREVARAATGEHSSEEIPDGGAEEEAGGGLDPEEEAPGVTRRRDIPEEEFPYLYDSITYTSGQKRWGEIRDVPNSGRRWGKYDIPFDDKPFYGVLKDGPSGRTIAGAVVNDRGNIAAMEFARTVVNFYGVRRRKVPDREPGRYDSLMALARALEEEPWRNEDERQEALGLAVKTYREALADEGKENDEAAILALSRALRKRGDWDADLALLEAATQRSRDGDLLAALGDVYEAFSLDDLARKVYEGGIAEHPTDSGLRSRLADLLFAEGELEGAKEHYAKLTQYASQGEDRRHGHLGLARVALRAGDLETAERALRSADSAGGENADSLAIRAAIRYLKGEREQAIQLAQSALEEAPRHPEATRTLGLALALENRIPEAETLLLEARDADPFLYADASLGLGLAAHLAGRVEASVEHYERAVAAAPDDPYGHYVLGVSYHRDGRHEEAMKALLRALELAPEFQDVLRQIALLHQSQGRWGEAAKYFRRAVDLEPEDGDLRYALISAILRDEERPIRSRLVEARTEIDILRKQRSDDVAALNLDAYVAYMLNPEKSEDVRATFDRVMRLQGERSDDPDAAYARRRVAEIRENASRGIWLDTFEGGDVQKGWQIHPKGRMRVQVRETGAMLSVPKHPEQSDVFFYYFVDPVALGHVLEVSVDLAVHDAEDHNIGLIFYKSTSKGLQGELSIGRGLKNRLVYRLKDRKNAAEEYRWKPVLEDPDDEESARPWPAEAGEFVRLTLRRSTGLDEGGRPVKAGTFDVFVNDELVLPRVEISTFRNPADKYSIGIVGSGAFNLSWKAEVRSARMVLRIRR